MLNKIDLEKAAYVVSFASHLPAPAAGASTDDAYDKTAAFMVKLALEEYECLGVHTARGADGVGITLSYWADMASIHAWRGDKRHQLAQQKGRDQWYSAFCLTVSKIERAYDFG